MGLAPTEDAEFLNSFNWGSNRSPVFSEAQCGSCRAGSGNTMVGVPGGAY